MYCKRMMFLIVKILVESVHVSLTVLLEELCSCLRAENLLPFLFFQIFYEIMIYLIAVFHTALWRCFLVLKASFTEEGMLHLLLYHTCCCSFQPSLRIPAHPMMFPSCKKQNNGTGFKLQKILCCNNFISSLPMTKCLNVHPN